jgi:branched-subunit amino acid aminotransferase/4-amino-4-deoxychorismate lyase
MSLPLEDALRQCDRHAQRMSRAMARIPFPLDGQELAQDNENLVTLIDQFVFRYTKLQDTLGEHVLRPFCTQVLLELVEDRPLADVLSLLERRGYLSADDWRMQRAMRNTLTHEYPEQVTWQAEVLNRARTMSLQLMDWLTRLSREFEQRKTP